MSGKSKTNTWGIIAKLRRHAKAGTRGISIEDPAIKRALYGPWEVTPEAAARQGKVFIKVLQDQTPEQIARDLKVDIRVVIEDLRDLRKRVSAKPPREFPKTSSARFATVRMRRAFKIIGPKPLPPRIAQRRAEIERLKVQGWKPTEIAGRMGLKHAFVSKELQAIIRVRELQLAELRRDFRKEPRE
jgi:hypothetical protein